MSIRVLTIINPTSGKGNIKNYIQEIRKNLEEQNMQVNIQITKKDYNAKKIVLDNIEETDLILVCGGDGTFNETVSAIMELGAEDVSIAYIPMGTTNDLARSLDMPIKDISITKKLLESKARILDVGRFNNDKYFCYVAAFGVITDVAYKTTQKAKNKFGRLAYYLKAIKELIRIPTYKVRIEFDEDAVKILKNFSLLTLKPIIYVANVDEEAIVVGDNDYSLQVKNYAEAEGAGVIVMCAKLEADLAGLQDNEREEFLKSVGITNSGLDKLIFATYNLLGLATFFTAGSDEVRAWTFKQGMKAPECAGLIHSDIMRGFIKAEVMSFDDLHELGDEKRVKEAGKLRIEGKDYIIKDGDICYFRFNV